MLLQQFQVQVFKNHGLNIWRTLGGNRVALERDVGWSEDAGLGVVDAQALDVGQVANAAGNRDVDVVLDTTGLGAVPHAQIGVPLVGAEWNKDDLCAALDRDPRDFGKLDVVANLNRNL